MLLRIRDKEENIEIGDVVSVINSCGYILAEIDRNRVAIICENAFALTPSNAYVRIYPTHEETLVFINGRLGVAEEYILLGQLSGIERETLMNFCIG